jgi:capsule polysaccharide export protein KpsE/RkpR
MNNQNYKPTSDDIDLKEFLSKAWETKKIFAVIMLSFGLISIIYSTNLPNLYTSESLVTIVSKDYQSSSSSGGMTSDFSGLASVAGLNIGMGGGDGRSALAIATIQSRDFLKHLIEFEGILPALMASQEFNHDSQEIIFDDAKYDHKNNKWIEGKPSYLEVHRVYRRMLSINLDRKSGFIDMKIEHLSPVFSKIFLELIIQEANNIVRKNELQESKLSLEYLNEMLLTTKQIDTKLAITQLIEGQLKTQMLANVRADYLLSPIDEAFLPLYKSNPARLRILVMWLLSGLAIYFLGLLVKLMISRD